MVELPKNFGMYECKDVEIYPEFAVNPDKDEKLGEFCLEEKQPVKGQTRAGSSEHASEFGRGLLLGIQGRPAPCPFSTRRQAVLHSRRARSVARANAFFFGVRASDGNIYVLRQDTSTLDGCWSLVSFREAQRAEK
jgi:hypothetical protein